MISASYTANGSVLNSTATAGAHSYNIFQGNLIQNCHVGIAMLGSSGGSFPDLFNVAGGTSAVSGNTVVNFGGGSGSASSAGVWSANQQSVTISCNIIDNNNGTGSSPLQTLYGISSVSQLQVAQTIESNTITVAATGSVLIGLFGIYEDSYGSSQQRVSISKNVFPSYTYSNSVNAGGSVIRRIGWSSSGNHVKIDSNLIGPIEFGTGTFTVINTVYTNDCSITGNTLTSFSAKSGQFMMVNYHYTSGLDINHNKFSNISVSGPGVYSLTCVAQHPGSNSNINIIGNLFENISLYSGSGGNWVRGVHLPSTSTGFRAINQNTISGVFTQTGSPYGFSFTGIEASGNQYAQVNQNHIFDVRSLHTTTSAAVTFTGIVVSVNGSPGTSVSENRVGGFRFNSSGQVSLIRMLSGGANNYFTTNVVGDVDCPNLNNEAMYGIHLSSGTAYVYYNTVYLNSTANPALIHGSAAFYNASSNTITIRNNIFTNESAVGSSGTARALYGGSSGFNWINPVSNNNIYYAGTPGPARLIAQSGFGQAYQTLSSYQATVSPKDDMSMTGTVPFAVTSATSASFLDISTTVPTAAESHAVPISPYSYVTDFGGNLRHPFSPDIGAWEGTYMKVDIAAPVVAESGFTGGACSTTGRTYTAAIYDVSGVASGSLAPRLYYRKNFTLYTSVQGTLAAGTLTNGVWHFPMNYAATTGDFITYFLAVQDQSPNTNVAVFPANNFSAIDVNNVSVPPIPPYSYTVTGSVLSGTYLVGAGQTYTSLSQAANAYNTSCLGGPVTFSLTDASYSTNEIFPITIQLNSDASATNSLLIRPAAGVSSTLNATGSPIAVLTLLDARHITIDGINQGGSALHLNNANTGTTAIVWLASGTGPLQGNQHITLTNLNLKGSTTTHSNSFGILAAAQGATVATLPSLNNDFITVSNSSILRVGNGIYANGAVPEAAGGLNSWLITGNTIGPAATGTNNLRGSGIFLRNCSDFSVTANSVSNASLASTHLAGIYLSENIASSIVHGNTISAIAADYFSSEPPVSGIYAGLNLYNCTISNNIISNISSVYSSGTAASGIVCDTWDGSGNMVFNNMIHSISGRGGYDPQYWTSGILLSRKTGSISIDHNSVNLAGSYTGRLAVGSNSLVTAALHVRTSGNSISLRNNILANSFDYTNHTTDKNYSFYTWAPASAFAVINNNNYCAVSNSSNNPVMAYAGGDLSDLPALQTALGGNTASGTLTPVFVSATDLHLQSVNANAFLDNAGMPLAGIATDIDGQNRSLSTPDVGADEFSAASCSLVTAGTITPISFTACSGQTLALVSTGTWTDSGISHQWQVAPTSTGTFTDVASAGTLLSYTTDALPAGMFYYRVRSTCSASNFSATSNVAPVVVALTPTVTAAASASVLCAGENLTLSATPGTHASYGWSGPSGFSSTAQSPVIGNMVPAQSGQYTVTASSGSCNSLPSTVSVVVQASPTLSIAGNTTICSGANSTLLATGANSYSWSTGSTASSVVVSPTVNTIYLVTGQYSNGCSSTASLAVFSNSLPLISISPASGSVCAGSAAGYTASGAASYTWSNGYVGSVLSVTPVTAANYTVLAQNPSGCSASQVLSVGIYTVPVLSLSASSASVCAGASTTLTATGAQSYTWSPGNIQSSVAVVNPSSSTSYTLRGSSGQGCVAQTIQPVTVIQLPAVAASSGTICTGASFTIQPTGAVSYTFSGGSAVVNPTGTSSYSVYGSNAAGCQASTPAVVNVVVAPLPTVSVNSGTMCAGTSFVLSPAGAATYSLSAGSATVSPALTTSYSVTGVSAEGCVSQNTAVATVSVVQSPTVAVSGGSLCSGESFTLLPAGAISYSYSSGGATVNPATTTSYSVWGINVSGCLSTAPAVAVITVAASPTVAAGGGTICSGETFTLTATGAASYTFSSGSPVVSPVSTTSYSVTGSGVSGCHSANTAVVTISVVPLPTVAVSGGTLCQGDSFTLVPTGASGYTYSGGTSVVSPTSNTSYSVIGSSSGCTSTNSAVANLSVSPAPIVTVSGGSVCSGSTFTLIPAGAGTYTFLPSGPVVSPQLSTTYSVSGTNSLGCSSINAATVTVLVNTTPTVTVNSGSICAGAIYTMTPGGAQTYTYSGGSSTVQPQVSSVYTIQGSGSGGCVSSPVTATVNVVPLPTVAVAGGSLCAGSSFTLNPSGAISYSYSGGSSTVAPVSNTTYSVWGINAGCLSAAPAVATLTVHQLPLLSVSGPGSSCAGAPLTHSVSGAASYTWNGSATGNLYSHSPITNTVLTVQGTSTLGCTATTVYAISVGPGPSLTVSGATTVCEGTPVSLFVSGTALTYTWSTGGSGNLITVTPSVSTVYSVTGTGLDGCLGTGTVVIYVNSAPVIQANASSNGICTGGSVTLWGGGALSYTWTGGVVNNAPFYPLAGNVYTLSGTAINGCTGSGTVQVLVHPLPLVTVSTDRDTVCLDEEITLSAGGANYYSWAPEGGLLPTAVLTLSASTVFTLTGTDLNGCTGTAQYTITTDPCTGLARHQQLRSVEVYPSPFYEMFYVTGPPETGMQLELYNGLGQLVHRAHWNGGKHQVSATHLAKGVYFVYVYSVQAGAGVFKLVKTE